MHEILASLTGTVPTPAAIGLGLVGLGLGLIWMRASASDKLASARRLSASTATYCARAETAYSGLRALTEPTQAVEVTQLRAATATRREQLTAWAYRQAACIREGAAILRDRVTPIPARPDWAEGEMTAVFDSAGDGDWSATPIVQLPDPIPVVLPAPEWPAPPPTPAAVPTDAPAGPQAPQQRVRRRDPARRLPARARDWNRSLLGLRVPALSLPDFPEMLMGSKSPRMPQTRTPRQLPHDPRRMTMLPPDPMRRYRRPAAVA